MMSVPARVMNDTVRGHEFEFPRAHVTSTLLNLLILPALYGWLEKGK